MELRVGDDRVVLVSAEQQTFDPADLAVEQELVDALREWAMVAATVAAMSLDDRATAALVARRGRQLVGRLAATIGAPVRYSDPVTGRSMLLAGPGTRRQSGDTKEPTPWGTGLTVSGLVCFVVVFAMIVLCGTVSTASEWFAFAANVVVTAGLVPSVLVVRRTPVWRWAALGVAVGIVLGWLAWLLSLL